MGVRVRSPKVVRWGLAGTLTLIGGTLVWFATDRVLARFFEDYRFRIEDQLSQPLGHPLEMGPYQGLRPWGIAIGPTKLQEGLDDKSTVKTNGLIVKFAPIASLRNWRPVVILSPEELRVNLIANENRSYWVLGARDGRPPNLDVHLQLKKSAKVTFKDHNLELIASGRAAFQLSKKKLLGAIQIALPDKGSIFLKGSGYWDRLDFKARARLNRLELESLQGVLSEKLQLAAKGNINGDFQVILNRDDLACRGDLALEDLFLAGGILKENLSTNKASVRCNDDQLSLAPSKWNYGPMKATLNGSIPLDKINDLEIRLDSSFKLTDVKSPGVNIQAKIPFQIKDRGVLITQLFADLNLSPFPLRPIGNLFGVPMSGTISASGKITGPISSLNTNLSIGLVNPQLSGLRLQEEWKGKFVGMPLGGGSLNIESVGASVPGNIYAQLSPDWLLEKLVLKRLGGQISVERKDNLFTWEANDFRLDRVEVAIPPEKSFKRIFGQLSGQGDFSLSPLSIDGQMTFRYPRLMGFRLKKAQLKGNYYDNTFDLTGKVLPPDRGEVLFKTKGEIGGALKANIEAKSISARWLSYTALQVPNINLKASSSTGSVKDLGGFFVQAFGTSLDGRLNALAKTKSSFREKNVLTKRNKIINPDKLRGQLDATIDLEGPNLSELNLDLKVSGQLWPEGKKDQIDFQNKPFVATIKGPLQGGTGDFSLLNIPFSLLYLLTPVPTSIKGMFGLAGKYRMGKGRSEVSADLIADNLQLGKKLVLLEKGKVVFSNSTLNLDLILRGVSSTQSLSLSGDIPLVSTLPINFKVESHGDGISFLDGITDGFLLWKAGRADLRFFIRGTIDNPKANGFLVINNGEILVMEKTVKALNTSMIFDFNRLEVQNLQATIGSKGIISGSGAISLFRPDNDEKNPFILNMSNVPFKLPIIDAEVASKLLLRGSLLQPVIGGELTLKEGSITPKRSTSKPNSYALDKRIPESMFVEQKGKIFPEQKWDMQEPLVLFVQEGEAPASKMLLSSIPSGLSSISFNNLKLRLGPNLRISSQPLANFGAAGLLNLNGAFDQTLNARGVVRLTDGRVNLFTTTFTLDRSEPNVAIFTPSMGLIPYLDVKMKSRVPDTIRDASNIASSSDFATNGTGSFGIGGSRFVKVEVTATGPADRLSENFQLGSTPPMPRNQLLGLIGGNSLTRLLGGGESEVLTNVLSRSLISPFLGNITGSFSERLEVSLYPAYVNAPEVSDESSDSESNPNEASGDLSPQRAWVTEIGIDLTNRFNFSVQATPNREDIPPQGTLSYQVNSNLDVLGSINKEGQWQSQLQLLLRF